MTVTDQKGIKHDMDDFSKANIDAEEENIKAEIPTDEEVSSKVVDDSEYGSL
ncbi:MAG: hypothetical protein MJ219_04270 [Mycoplasmoidaceae bacterium]|nr:hypothetical protein [Mycoplasmoidaceae bacterium]